MIATTQVTSTSIERFVPSDTCQPSLERTYTARLARESGEPRVLQHIVYVLLVHEQAAHDGSQKRFVAQEVEREGL